MTDYQFLRDVYIEIGSLILDSRNSSKDSTAECLRVSFKTNMTISTHPNTCDITIYNLSQSTRKEMAQGLNQTFTVKVMAGYKGDRQLVYLGQSYEVKHARTGTDWISTIRCQEGREDFTKARVNVSIPPGASLLTVIETLAKNLPNIDITQVKKKVNEDIAAGKNPLKDFQNGFSSTGAQVEKLLQAIQNGGYEASVQMQSAVATRNNETVANPRERNGFEVVNELTPESGLIGSPEVGLGGMISVRSLLNGHLLPHRQVIIRSQNLSETTYKIVQAQHTGDTWGQDWYTDLVVISIKQQQPGAAL